MRSSVSPKLDQTRGVHRVTKSATDVQKSATLKLKIKIYQVLLVLICLSLVYYWHKSILFPMRDSKEVDTNGGKASGYINYLFKKLAKHAMLLFVMFITDPFNLTLIMMCLFSRIVLNFVTFRVSVTFYEVWFGYDIDESYFVPSSETSSAVDV